MTIKTMSSLDGPRIVVNDFLKDPMRVPALVLDLAKQGFLADALLRDAGQNAAGAVRYEESTPLYADDDVENRSEFSEVPIVGTSAGTPRVTFVSEKAAAVAISDEERRRQTVDPVMRKVRQVRNSMVRAWDKAFVDSVMTHPGVQTLAATGPWATATASSIRRDINNARELIESATTDDAQASELAFESDTLILNRGSEYDILNNEDFQKPYVGDNASENLLYTGKLPKQILTLDAVRNQRLPAGKAIVMQRNVAGFISDEVPLTGSALYRDEPRKTWRSDFQRASAMGLDQPKAICIITGV